MHNYPSILHTCDWHLGHDRTPTEDTVDSIRKYLLPRLNEVDLLLISGDIFDQKIDFDNISTSTILDIFADILFHCYENEVVVRVLQGTYSHDRDQLIVWRRLYKKLAIPVDFQIIRKLSIEIINSLGISILYIPDNLPYKTKEEVLQQIQQLLISHGLTKVDYVSFHGEFEHLGFVHHFNNDLFRIDDFKSIVNKRILAGHIHKPSQFKNLIYGGSINRLAHDEDHDKGFWIIDGNDKASFIKNETANWYITKDYSEFTEVEELLEHHKSIVESFPKDRLGYLRVKISNPHLKQTLRSYHEPYSKQIRLTWFNRKVAEKETFLDSKLKSVKTETFEIPSKENLPNLITKHLVEIHKIELTIEEVQEVLYVGNL